MRAPWLPALLASWTLAAAAGEVPPPAPSESVSITGALSRSTYGTSPDALLLKIGYAADTRASHRPPLDIALVLDRSASMDEDMKFGHALTAVREVIANMTDKDVLSIVAFNERATVLVPGARVVNKPYLFHRLEEVQPSGITDLSAGLLEGIAQVESQSGDGLVRYVLLLTDGVANSGVTDPAALEALVKGAAGRGIHVSTLGCGTDFNEKLLGRMAAAGGGRYTYVRSAEQLPAAFATELQGLLETVAQNMTVRVAVRGGRVVKVFGRPQEGPSATSQADVGNLRAGERGSLLLEVAPSELRPDGKLAVDVTLTFDDPRTGGRVTRSLVAESVYSTQAAGTERPDVTLYGDVLRALEEAEEAALSLDVERYRDASAAFGRVYESAHRYAVEARDQDLLNETFVLKHFMKELTAAEKEGLLHDHRQARDRLSKESDYRRYLLSHHRTGQ